MVLVTLVEIMGGSTSSITVTCDAKDCCRKPARVKKFGVWYNDLNSDHTSHTMQKDGWYVRPYCVV